MSGQLREKIPIKQQVATTIQSAKEKAQKTFQPMAEKVDQYMWERVGRDSALRQFEKAGAEDPEKAVQVVEFFAEHMYTTGYKKNVKGEYEDVRKSYKFNKSDIGQIMRICGAVDDPVEVLEKYRRVYKLDNGTDSNSNGIGKIAHHLESFEHDQKLPRALDALTSVGGQSEYKLVDLKIYEVEGVQKIFIDAYRGNRVELPEPIGEVVKLPEEEIKNRFSAESVGRMSGLINTLNESAQKYLSDGEEGQEVGLPADVILELSKVSQNETTMAMYRGYMAAEFGWGFRGYGLEEKIADGLKKFEAIVTAVPELVALFEHKFDVYIYLQYQRYFNQDLTVLAADRPAMRAALNDPVLCKNAEILGQHGLSITPLPSNKEYIDFVRSADSEKLDKAMQIYSLAGNGLGMYKETPTPGSGYYKDVFNFYTHVWRTLGSGDSAILNLPKDEIIACFARISEPGLVLLIPFDDLINNCETTAEINRRIEVAQSPAILAYLAKIRKENDHVFGFWATTDPNERSKVWRRIFEDPDLFLKLDESRAILAKKLEILEANYARGVARDLKTLVSLLQVPDEVLEAYIDKIGENIGSYTTVESAELDKIRIISAQPREKLASLSAELVLHGTRINDLLDDRLSAEALSALVGMDERKREEFWKVYKKYGEVFDQGDNQYWVRGRVSENILFYAKLLENPNQFVMLDKYLDTQTKGLPDNWEKVDGKQYCGDKLRLLLALKGEDPDFDMGSYIDGEGHVTAKFLNEMIIDALFRPNADNHTKLFLSNEALAKFNEQDRKFWTYWKNEENEDLGKFLLENRSKFEELFKDGVPTAEYYVLLGIEKAELAFDLLSANKTLTNKQKTELYAYLIGKLVEKKSERAFSDYAVVLGQELEINGHLDPRLTAPLLHKYRLADPLLPVGLKSVTDEAVYERFNLAIVGLLRATSEGGSLAGLRKEFFSDYVLQYLARQPERFKEITELPKAVPKLMEYMSEGGPLKNVRGSILSYVFGNGDVVGRARVIEAAFTTNLPYWTQLFLFTDSIIGESLAGAATAYPVMEIPKIKVDLTDRQAFMQAEGREREVNIARFHVLSSRPIAQMTVKEKRAYLRDDLKLIDEEVATMSSIPFKDLKGIVKKTIWLDRLKQTIERSRDEQQKNTADARNRQSAQVEFKFETGMYIHGAPLQDAGANVLDYILTTGNLPKEALGSKAGTDSYPFQIDFSIMTELFLAENKTTREAITKSISESYGNSGNLGHEGQMWLVYDRNRSSYDAGITHLAQSSTHGLMLGGVPSTEISSIILRSPEANFDTRETVLANVSRLTVENGFYVPIYDMDGKLLFTVEDYDNFRKRKNYQVPVPIIDYSQKVGEQGGSNEGGSFLIPDAKGAGISYLKFARSLETDTDPLEAENRVWNEQLADSIYRTMGILVPETGVYKIRENNTYAHGSKWLEGERDTTISREGNYRAGAVIDWLTANWDIQHDQNLLSIGGQVYRLDNGGALLYRARGERKAAFGATVTEIESMRGAYPGLSKEEIGQQIEQMKAVLTDEKIDELVEATRMKEEDREYLKTVLKERRDYVESYFEAHERVEAASIPEKGQDIARKIDEMIMDNRAIVADVPEFERLFGENGYQHNKVLLGEHIRSAAVSLKESREYASLSADEQILADVAILFHDIGKPTGALSEDVARDFGHEVPSADTAANYMKKWGFSNDQISRVTRVILNDGIASDIARGKVRDKSKQYTPKQFAEAVKDMSTLRILEAVNRADVVATVGEDRFNEIKDEYDALFRAAQEELL